MSIISSMNLKIKQYNSYFERKNSLLVFLLILLGVLIPTLSGTPTNNFWYRLNAIMTDNFYNMMLFISIGINTIYYSNELTKNMNAIVRYKDYRDLVGKFIQDIFWVTIYLYVIGFLVAIAGAILFCFGDFSILNHQYYNISLPIYIFILFLRGCILNLIINSIIYLILIYFNKYISTTIILILGGLYFTVPAHAMVTHFYNMPLIYHYYFIGTIFSSIILEVVCSLIEIFILYMLYKILFNIATCKKRDII